MLRGFAEAVYSSVLSKVRASSSVSPAASAGERELHLITRKVRLFDNLTFENSC